MAKHICPVCGCMHEYDTAILIHKNLRAIPEDERVAGVGLCGEHAKLAKDGYVALVAIDGDKSVVSEDGTVKPENAYRTGKIAHLKRDKCAEIFNVPIPDHHDFIYCDEDVITMLEKTNEQI
ncbi:hypothetical protein OAP32_00510 [Crocinitomicaceae bacterium]|nr:hypothetical protein [Crocinitomicaceae bacterium]